MVTADAAAKPRAGSNWQASGMTNHYEANLSNTASRMGAWVRGILRRYRRPIVMVGAAAATLVVGVSAGMAPARPAAATTNAAVGVVAGR